MQVMAERSTPLILTLDNHGVPNRWITWQQACFYYARNLVAWTLGERAFTFYGGLSRATGERSSSPSRAAPWPDARSTTFRR